METYVLDKWSHVKSLIDQLNSEGEFIWRGHADSKFDLSSSLYRHLFHQNIQESNWPDIEFKALNYFRDSIAYTKINAPTDLTWIDVMQIMQHHGCPTRLLDWTFSPYIATYFTRYSLASKTLFALNLEQYKKKLGENYSDLHTLGGQITNLKNKLFISLIRSSRKFPPLPIKPAPFFERPLMQKSIFLLDLSLEPSLSDKIDEIQKSLLIKIEFPESVIREAFRDLEMMNIDGYHLFGGAEGVAQKAKEFIYSR